MNGHKKGQDESGDTRECEAMRKLFVGGLNRDTTDEVFVEHFGQYGTMLDKVIIKDTQTRVSRGFGFVTYETSDSVEKVFQARPHVIDGKTLDVKRAMPREYNTSTAHAKVTKLFIGGIGPDLTPAELQEYIESRHPTDIGTIDNIDFLKDKETGKNKGFGFFECSSTDFADRLTISENSFTLNGKNMGMKKAEPKPGEGGQQAPRGGRGGGFQSRGRGRGRGGGGGYGDRSNNYGGGYDQTSNGYNSYSTGYPVYGANAGYQQSQSAGGNYGSQGGYGYGNQGSGGGKRYQPY